ELRRAGPDAAAGLIETIESEAARLGRYIANLLGMARIEAGAIRLRAEPVDLIDAVAAAARDLRESLAGRRVRIDVPPDLPLVSADPELLHHCLINLLDNAARYSPPGSAIAIEGCRDQQGVRLAVLDEGNGIPGEGGAAIFSRFARIAGSDRKGGAGLGLAIVGGFAGAMGIGVSAANRPDRQGAVFSLDFPAALLVREPAEGAAD
ncbi:MAG: histidine kinase, partial [Sphingomonadaceae bacterium]|nr:histidine kinase [Sphingomonadaceae bacterium]